MSQPDNSRLLEIATEVRQTYADHHPQPSDDEVMEIAQDILDFENLTDEEIEQIIRSELTGGYDNVED